MFDEISIGLECINVKNIFEQYQPNVWFLLGRELPGISLDEMGMLLYTMSGYMIYIMYMSTIAIRADFNIDLVVFISRRLDGISTKKP